ncbi:MAG: hypothetical protein AAGK05_08370, partial [Pseudomonadota bacterium]
FADTLALIWRDIAHLPTRRDFAAEPTPSFRSFADTLVLIWRDIAHLPTKRDLAADPTPSFRSFADISRCSV